MRLSLVALFFFLATALLAQSPEAKLKEMSIELSAPKNPIANYLHYRQIGNTVYLAGKGAGKGKLGDDLSVEQGYEAARQAGIRILSVLNEATGGNLGKVKQFVSVRGMVNATADFEDHSKVINGFSDLMVEVFGEKGKHARAAVGMSSLPKGMAVEIEVVVELEQ